MYTKLDAPRADAILRSSFILPKLSYSTYTTPVTANPILVFNVTQKDRVKKLYIGCHYQPDSFTNRSDKVYAANDIANFYAIPAASDLSHYVDRKSRLGFFV